MEVQKFLLSQTVYKRKEFLIKCLCQNQKAICFWRDGRSQRFPIHGKRRETMSYLIFVIGVKLFNKPVSIDDSPLEQDISVTKGVFNQVRMFCH